MRLSWKRLGVLLTAALVVLPVLAQIPGFGGFQFGLAQLVQNKSVQEELKMTDEQVAKVKEIADKSREKFKDELEKGDFKAKFEIFKKVNDSITETVTKDLDKLLKPEQIKRLKQIEIQQLGVEAFTKDSVIKDLKLNDDQTTKIKTLTETLQKDTKAAFEDAGKGKFQEAFKKVGELKTATMEKVTGVLTDTQKTKWKDLTGDKFELKFGGFKGGKDKDK
jgi:hypothetical protein